MRYSYQLKHRNFKTKTTKLITVTVIQKHPVVTQLEKETFPHLNYRTGDISIGLGANIHSATTTQKRATPLQRNREVKHENVFYSKSTRTYGFWYFSLLDGQFISETGYAKPHNARQALSRIITQEKKELLFSNKVSDEHGSLSWELEDIQGY